MDPWAALAGSTCPRALGAHTRKDRACTKPTKQEHKVLVSWVSCTERAGVGGGEGQFKVGGSECEVESECGAGGGVHDA
jgi:hypothetical protein